MKKWILIIILLIMCIFFAADMYFKEEEKKEIEKIRFELSNIEKQLKPYNPIKITEADIVKYEIKLEKGKKLEVFSELFEVKTIDNKVSIYFGENLLTEVFVEYITRYKLAILIDDVGMTTKYLDDFTKIDEKINYAVLPFLPRSKKCGDILKENGDTVILHMPMESSSNQKLNEKTPGIILTKMTDQAIENKLAKALSDVGEVAGVNNHMGSKFTSDKAKMHVILSDLKGKGLFYVDSRTSKKSVAYETAKELGIKTAYCSVFIDNEKNVDYIKKRIELSVRRVLKEEKLVVIGHYHPKTAQAIYEMKDFIREKNIELVDIREILE